VTKQQEIKKKILPPLTEALKKRIEEMVCLGLQENYWRLLGWYLFTGQLPNQQC